MKNLIQLSEIHAALMNEVFIVRSNNVAFNVEIQEIDHAVDYADDIVIHDIHLHIYDDVADRYEMVDVSIKEQLENSDHILNNLRDSKEVKALMELIVAAAHHHVSKEYKAHAVKSLLKQAAVDHYAK